MKLRSHSIPRDAFDALAAGGGGPEAVSVLAAAERSKHDILLRGVLAAAARAADTTQARYASVGWEVLTEAKRLDRDAADRVMRYPAVGAWAVSTLSALDPGGRPPGAGPARLAAVAAAAAVRSGLDVEVPVLPVAGVVSLPSLGAARVAADSAVVHSHPGGAEIRWPAGRVEIPLGGRPDAPGWLGIRDCRAGNLEAVIEDLDPFRMPAEVAGLAPRLTAGQARDWQRALQQGWEVLAAVHPAVAAEVAAAISVIVPLSRSVHGHLSSSSPDTFGALAMSEPPDPDTCASTLTHELQHVKLCAVLDIVKLTSPDDGSRYYAPWRDDPRPIAGLLQGAYAHVGVTEFWRHRRQATAGAGQLRADGEFALWRAGTTRVIETLLASDRLTVDGTDFVRRMLETADSWMSEPVSAQAQAFALREARSHLARWERRHGPVPHLTR
jgi:HEXXH motif-containing protein